MVSESDLITFKPEWEKAAMNGEEFPEGCTSYPNQIYYLELRMLYAQLKQGDIDRPTAIREKKRLFEEYGHYAFREKLGNEWVQVIKVTEIARAQYRKNPCHENAMLLIEIIEGRKLHEQLSESL